MPQALNGVVFLLYTRSVSIDFYASDARILSRAF